MIGATHAVVVVLPTDRGGAITGSTETAGAKGNRMKPNFAEKNAKVMLNIESVLKRQKYFI